MRVRTALFAVTGLLAVAGPLVAQTNFEATLDGDQAGSGSSATGTAVMTFSAAQDALTYEVTIVGLDLDGLQTADPNDDVTAMHFHLAPAGVNGPVIFGLISPNNDVDDLVIDPVAGTITGVWEETDTTNVPPNTLSDYFDDLFLENLYINVHTTAFPAGEIRGQVVQAPLSVLDVPTLGQAAMVALGALVAGLGLQTLRRRRVA